MSTAMESIRALAGRVARSSGLDLVDIEFQGGGGRHRTLRVFLERDAAGRAALADRLAALRQAPDAEPDWETDDGIVLDMVAAGETAGLSAEEDDLAYLREVPAGVPVAQLSGITHGDCERFAREFGTALDVEDLVAGTEYTLEVSSPGLDRKLQTPEDFERFAGQLCKVQTFTPVQGNRHWRGRLGATREGEIVLEPVAEKQGKKKSAKAALAEPLVIAFANVEKAQLVPEF